MLNSSYAFVFPGQGSQAVGMLADTAPHFPEITSTFSEASDALGYDLQQLAFNGPQEKLNQTEFTQPALLAASYAVWRIARAHGKVKPAVLAGHSLGEYTALVAADAIAFQDAIKLVAARGQFMQAAVTSGEGAMAAIIGLSDEMVADICKDISNVTNAVIAPANYNSVGQVVIAGHSAAVQQAIEIAKEKGAKMAVLIPVSVPSHCELMRPAAERLKAILADTKIEAPTIPVLNNVDVSVYQHADHIRDGLIRQLYMPVRWVEIIKTMQQKNIHTIIECGPGKVLSGLNKRIDKSLELQSLCDLASIENLLTLAKEE